MKQETKLKKTLPPVAFFDVDGTLYDHKHNEIPALHMKAIHELREQGVKVCLCTGRALPLMENLGVVDAFDWDGIIGGNGAFVCDKDNHTLFEHYMDPIVVKDVFERASQQGVSLFVSGNTVFTTDLLPRTQKMLHDFSVQGIPTRNLEEQDRLSIICLLGDDLDQVAKDYGNFSGMCMIKQSYAIELIPEGLSKYHGIRVLLDHFGIEEDDYIAFGDSYNDVEMLEHAKISCVMEDGDARVLEAFSTHCPSASVGGIYTFLHEEHYL